MKPPTRKFPLCEKYGLLRKDGCFVYSWNDELASAIEQAFSRLEKKASDYHEEVLYYHKRSEKLMKQLSQAEQNGKEQGKRELVELLEKSVEIGILTCKHNRQIGKEGWAKCPVCYGRAEVVNWLKSQIKEGEKP